MFPQKRFYRDIGGAALAFAVAMMVMSVSVTAQQTPANKKAADKKAADKKAAADKKTIADKAAADQKAADDQGGKNPPPPAPGGSKAPALPQEVASNALKQPDQQGDYIPCHFTLAELRNLNAPELASVLSPQDAEKMRSRIMQAYLPTDGDDTREVREQVIAKLATEKLAGLTPSEALAKVIGILAKIRGDLQKPASSDQKIQAAKPSIDLLKKLGVSEIEPFTRAIEASPLTQMDIMGTAPGVRRTLQEFAAETNNPKLKELAKKPDDQTAVLTKPAPLTFNTDSAVDAARQFLATLERPVDVGCAMSILSWDEAARAYGHTIANTYIVVQVIVRNVNRDQQFIVHDVEFATNTDTSGRLGRYFSGRDKIVVRALASSQQSFDPRNLSVNVAKALGAVMSSAAPIWGGALVDAAGVVNGAFIPSLDKYWKDLSTDQLNLLNDTGFSSSVNSQTVVPKAGTVMFATFIPAITFEQGWWAQPCVQSAYLGTASGKGKFKAPVPSVGPQSGIDINRYLEVCYHYPLGPAVMHRKVIRDPLFGATILNLSTTGSNISAEKETAKLEDSNSAGASLFDEFLDLKTVRFRKWSPTSFAIFRDLSNVVVSGLHIVEQNQLNPSLDKLTCSTDDQGTLKFSDPAKDTLVCTAAGKNLDKISRIRLRKSTDQTDPTVAEATVAVSGDNTTASATFKVNELRDLPASDYTVYWVGPTGTEHKTSQAIHLDLTPYVSAAPAALDYTKADPQRLTLTGFHLDMTQTIILKDTAKAKDEITVLDPLRTAHSVSVDIPSSAIKNLKKDDDSYSLSLTYPGSPKPLDLTLKVQIKSPTPPAAGAATPPGAPPVK